MSTAAELVPDTNTARIAIPLLIEYAEKLKSIAATAHDLLKERGKLVKSDPVIRDELVARMKHIRPPAEELVRRVSAVVDQGRVSSLERVELWLRLAEFEHYLELAKRAVAKLG